MIDTIFDFKPPELQHQSRWQNNVLRVGKVYNPGRSTLEKDCMITIGVSCAADEAIKILFTTNIQSSKLLQLG